jgi:hypothetical protein
MYSKTMERMKNNCTNGSEFTNGIVIPGVVIGHTKCDYCGKEIIAVWDEHNAGNWWPYLGNQAKRPKTYLYSEIIVAMRKHFHVENYVWNEIDGNNLLNVHARVHSKPTNWSKRASASSIRLLCNSCFQKTYNRIQVKGVDGILYALSVVEDRGETVQSVMKDLGIVGTVIGRGAIREY